MGVFAPKKAFVLESLCGSEQFGVDHRSADRGRDRTYGFANGIEEGRARVFHQVPAVGDLDDMPPHRRVT